MDSYTNTTWVLIIAAGACIQGAIGAAIGHYKGRTLAGFWLGFFLGVIGWVLVALGPTVNVRVRARPIDPRSLRVSADDPDIKAHLARKSQAAAKPEIDAAWEKPPPSVNQG